MPYEWVLRHEEAPERSGASLSEAAQIAELHLWPHRSLPRRGFVIVITVMAVMLALPLIGVLGTPLLWGLLPFALAALAGLWTALSRSYRDGEVLEVLRLWPDRVSLQRVEGGRQQVWEANPHWVRVTVYPEGGPVANYLTLTGAGREVEIGAFLSEEERLALLPELQRHIG